KMLRCLRSVACIAICQRERQERLHCPREQGRIVGEMDKQLRIVAPSFRSRIEQLIAQGAGDRSFQGCQGSLRRARRHIDEAPPQDVIELGRLAERAIGAKQALGEPDRRWFVVKLTQPTCKRGKQSRRSGQEVTAQGLWVASPDEWR